MKGNAGPGHSSGLAAGPAADLAGDAQRVAELRFAGAEFAYAATAGECIPAREEGQVRQGMSKVAGTQLTIYLCDGPSL